MPCLSFFNKIKMQQDPGRAPVVGGQFTNSSAVWNVGRDKHTWHDLHHRWLTPPYNMTCHPWLITSQYYLNTPTHHLDQVKKTLFWLLSCFRSVDNQSSIQILAKIFYGINVIYYVPRIFLAGILRRHGTCRIYTWHMEVMWRSSCWPSVNLYIWRAIPFTQRLMGLVWMWSFLDSKKLCGTACLWCLYARQLWLQKCESSVSRDYTDGGEQLLLYTRGEE